MSEHPTHKKAPTTFALIVTSDTRTEREDETGRIAVGLIEADGHRVVSHTIIPNDAEKIKAEVQRMLLDDSVAVVVTSGGTGIGAKDKTVAAVAPLFEKEMIGFGELFRRISYDEIGGAAMMSRATAGIARGKLIFCLPGSRNAMKVALTKIILPNVGHMHWELNR
ncbi:TPA: molybdenum cofactor biosynthesis protein MoaB [Candidatus Bathyarchaeota archaeon]|nr:molybdenum cofactor biosynthesis protein MoaB [Candidatus Bathyarchaeota archaeon]